jgi:hypothetical protein
MTVTFHRQLGGVRVESRSFVGSAHMKSFVEVVAEVRETTWLVVLNTKALMRCALNAKDARARGRHAAGASAQGWAEMEGQALGDALHWAHWLVDHGADPSVVRTLLELALTGRADWS